MGEGEEGKEEKKEKRKGRDGRREEEEEKKEEEQEEKKKNRNSGLAGDKVGLRSHSHLLGQVHFQISQSNLRENIKAFVSLRNINSY